MRVLLALLMMGLAGIGLAIKTHQHFVEVDNARFITRLELPTALTTNGRISGTRVPVTTIAKVKDILPRPVDRIVEARLWKSKLTVGGQLVYDRTYPVVWSGPPYDLGPESEADFPLVGESPDPIFASTNFVHGVSVAVELKNTYRYLYLSQSEGEPVEVTATVPVEPYNVVALWRTTVDESGNPLDDTSLGYVTAAYNVSKSWFESASVNYVRASNQEWRSKLDLQNDLKTATAVWGLTHGSPTDLADSIGTTTPFLITWAEFQNSMMSPATVGREHVNTLVPPATSVAAYACQTRFFGLGVNLESFHPYHEPPGSSVIINSHLLYVDVSYYISGAEQAHISRVWTELNNGKTIEQAVKIANVACPLDGEDGPVAVNVLGDGLATLNHVYVPAWYRATQSKSYVNTDWYWFVE